MKKSLKIFGVLALLAGTGYVLYKKYKQEMKKLEKEEKEENEKLEQLGVSKEKIEEEMVPGDNNLVKALYTGVEFNSKWDLDFIDIDGCLKNENVIHVGISDTPNGKQDLAFLLEIPAFNEGNYKAPKIKDFISNFSSAANHLWYDIVKVAPRESGRRPITRLEGYFVIAYRKPNDSEEYFKFIKIPEELYRPYAHGKHDGLVEYVSALRSGREKFGEVDCMGMVDDDGNPITKAKAIDVQLFFKIAFPIQTNTEDGPRRGINLETGLQCLEYLVNKVEILGESGDDKDRVTYDHIMFHAQDEKTEEWSLFKYYTVKTDKDGNRRVIIDEFTY